MSGDKFFLKCYKCNTWYYASCHWYLVHDKIPFQRRDKRGDRVWQGVDSDGDKIPLMDDILLPRIKVESIEAHQCARGNKEYGV